MKRFIIPILFVLFIMKLGLNGCGGDTTIINNNNNTVPDPPSLTSPPNGSIDSSLTITFNWNSSSGATSYKIQIATDTGFSAIVNENTISSTSYTVASGVLQQGTTYFWRVKGINANGEGNYSGYWSFHTVNIITISLAGSWVLIYNAGTQLDVCPGEQVVFPSNTGGTAQLTCPGQSTISRAYSVNGNTLTYTASGVQYGISFTSNNELVLTGINNNRILYYAHSIVDKKSTDNQSDNSRNSSE